MPSRRPQGPPPIQSRDFTLDDIENGIRKLKRRIDEVRALDPRAIHFDNARVGAATRNIQTEIGDIFGRNSPEYLAHGSHSVGYPHMVMGMEDHRYQQYFAEGLPQTIAMLEGLI